MDTLRVEINQKSKENQSKILCVSIATKFDF